MLLILWGIWFRWSLHLVKLRWTLVHRPYSHVLASRGVCFFRTSTSAVGEGLLYCRCFQNLSHETQMLFQVGRAFQVAEYTFVFRLSRSEHLWKMCRLGLSVKLVVRLNKCKIFCFYTTALIGHILTSRSKARQTAYRAISLHSYFLIPPRLTAFWRHLCF